MKRLTLLIPLVLACSSRPLGGHALDGGTTSTTDLDSCSSDADCLLSCIWITAPTTSNDCTAQYCCGMTWLSQKRCDANRAAWASYCPTQAPTSFPCPCVQLCQNETFSCIGGHCTTSCPPVGSSGGASGNGGGGGVGGANAGSGGSSASSIPIGAFLSVSVSDGDGWSVPGYACGVRSDGTLACWGDNTGGEASPPAGTFTSVSAGVSVACGLRTDGTIACWGDNTDGEASPPAGSYASVSVGANYACGIQAAGTIACWGDNTYGEASPPSGVFTSISAGYSFACGVRANGTVACWGNSGSIASPPSGSFLSVSVGYAVACGLRTDGTVSCWGGNGDFHPGESTPPAGTFASISAGATSACGVRADGSVACWGESGGGYIPGGAPPAGTFSSVSAGSPLGACAVNAADRSLACWQLPVEFLGGY
jgi:hypothetical protein